MARAATKTKAAETKAAPAEEQAPELKANVLSKADAVAELGSPPEAANEDTKPWDDRPRRYDEGLSQIGFHDMHLASHAYNRYRIKAKDDHRALDVLQPEYLWNVAGERLNRGDVVECTNVDFDYMVELLILKRRPDIQSFEVRVLNMKIFDKNQDLKADLSDAEITEKTGAAKWCVERRGEMLMSGLSSRAEAQAWIARAQLL